MIDGVCNLVVALSLVLASKPFPAAPVVKSEHRNK
jgi:hypothetical protein